MTTPGALPDAGATSASLAVLSSQILDLSASFREERDETRKWRDNLDRTYVRIDVYRSDTAAINQAIGQVNAEIASRSNRHLNWVQGVTFAGVGAIGTLAGVLISHLH